ncbi:hypothetical protein C6N75_10330 [Streptomyces solincola]|uniref:Uncharacterized protein n=1 Tax=Streptomyces solincola TaxID=2100817 RepID=A0A2S9PY51_9ACTN|nr:hypothetical protein C6N75_10330 [Streptomyces solincola]
MGRSLFRYRRVADKDGHRTGTRPSRPGPEAVTGRALTGSYGSQSSRDAGTPLRERYGPHGPAAAPAAHPSAPTRPPGGPADGPSSDQLD